jgi:CheY-like chemotaxis protein
LGLAAVQGIIRGHRGALLVHSELNAGTRFDVLLPASKDQVVPLINQESPTVERTEAFILIVDDEDDVRVAISDALTFLGYRILMAENGQEALAKYQQYGKEIGLILLDITMPVLSGMETLSLLEQNQLASPVIFMSGYEEKRLDAFKQSEQVVGFLKKPFRLEILMRTIKSAFRQGTAVETRLHV